LKYSNSIQQLKTLQGQKEEEPQRYHKKGTSLYLKEMMERQKNNSMIFSKSPLRVGKKLEIEEEAPEAKRMFLPIEAFDPLLDVEDPLKILDDYKDGVDDLTYALSKWNFPNGDADLRRCIVSQYLRD
jgi:hypothetical protein